MVQYWSGGRDVSERVPCGESHEGGPGHMVEAVKCWVWQPVPAAVTSPSDLLAVTPFGET